MAQELTLRVAGLVTDPNEIDPAMPMGAMKRADNIIIRRRGVAQMRPGFPTLADFEAERVDAIIPFEGDYTVLADDAGARLWLKSDGTPILPPDDVEVAFTIGVNTLTITGPEDVLVGLPTTGTVYVVDPGLPPAEGGVFWPVNTLVTDFGPVISGIRTWTLSENALATGVACDYWPFTTAGISSYTAGGVVPAGSTTMEFNAIPPDTTFFNYIQASGTPLGSDSAVMKARTKITDYNAGSPGSLTFSPATIGSINPDDPFSLFLGTLPGRLGAIDQTLSYVIGETSWAEMQKRLYVTMAETLARYADASDTVAERAGLMQPGQALVNIFESDSEGWLGIGDMVAYRIVLARTIGDQLILSAPSAPSFIEATVDWANDPDEDLDVFYVLLAGRLPPDATIGDQIQIYRTPTAEAENNPTTPGDEMRLLSTVTLDAEDLLAQSWHHLDLSPDSQLTGAALYTNATQQGILAANTVPPRMGCVTTYSDMMFGGNTRTGQALVLSLIGTPTSGAFDYADPTRLWPALQVISNDIVVTITEASDTITLTGPVDTLNWSVDDYIADVGGNIFTNGAIFLAGTYITNIINNTPTLMTIAINQNAIIGGNQLDRIKASQLGAAFTIYQSSNNGTDSIFVTTGSRGMTVGQFVTNDGVRVTDDGTTIALGTSITSIQAEGGDNFEFGISNSTTGKTRVGDPMNVWLVDWQNPDTTGSADATVVDIKVGSPVITIIGPAARFAFVPFQEITDYDLAPKDAGAVWPAGTEVVSVARVDDQNIQITVSEDALADSDRFAVWDWIAIDGRRNYGAQKAIFDAHTGREDIYLYDQSYLWSLQGLTSKGAYVGLIKINGQAFGSGAEPRTLIFASPYLDTAPITVTSCKPNAFAEDVNATTGVTSASEENLNRLVWSKTQEPDAWPLPYFVDIGSASKRILRVLPTRESLFVFKEDGTWRVTGFSPTSLRVDEYDRTLRLIHPDGISQVDNNLFGWFISGVMVVTDAQTANVSDNFIGEELGLIRQGPERPPPGDDWTPDVWAFTVERDNEWHLITGDGTGNPKGLQYIFDLVTNAWVTWTMTQDIALSCGTDFTVGQEIYLGGTYPVGTPPATVFHEEKDELVPRIDGGIIPMTNVSGVNEGEYPSVVQQYQWRLTYDANTQVTRGSAIGASGVRVVTEVISSTECIAYGADTPDFGPVGGALFPSVNSAMEWTSKTQQNPGKRKHFREVNYTFQVMPEESVDLYFSTDINANAHIAVNTGNAGNAKPYFLRALIPRGVARGTWLNPRLDIPGVFGGWRVDACNLVYEWMNERTGR